MRFARWLICGPSGRVSRGLPLACKSAKIEPPIQFRQLRTTYGSLLLNAEPPLSTISELFGPQGYAADARHYARLLSEKPPSFAQPLSAQTCRYRRASLQDFAAAKIASITSLGLESIGNVAAVRVNLSALSPAENRQRKLDNYTEMSPDPAKTCSGCSFFTSGAEPTACGQCQIFNGPANHLIAAPAIFRLLRSVTEENCCGKGTVRSVRRSG
jgi:hypothetical protein